MAVPPMYSIYLLFNFFFFFFYFYSDVSLFSSFIIFKFVVDHVSDRRFQVQKVISHERKDCINGGGLCFTITMSHSWQRQCNRIRDARPENQHRHRRASRLCRATHDAPGFGHCCLYQRWITDSRTVERVQRKVNKLQEITRILTLQAAEHFQTILPVNRSHVPFQMQIHL